MKKPAPKLAKGPVARGWTARNHRARKPKRGPYRRICPAYFILPRALVLT